MDSKSQIKFELLKHEMDTVQSGMRAYSQVQFTISGHVDHHRCADRREALKGSL